MAVDEKLIIGEWPVTTHENDLVLVPAKPRGWVKMARAEAVRLGLIEGEDKSHLPGGAPTAGAPQEKKRGPAANKARKTATNKAG